MRTTVACLALVGALAPSAQAHDRAELELAGELSYCAVVAEWMASAASDPASRSSLLLQAKLFDSHAIALSSPEQVSQSRELTRRFLVTFAPDYPQLNQASQEQLATSRLDLARCAEHSIKSQAELHRRIQELLLTGK